MNFLLFSDSRCNRIERGVNQYRVQRGLPKYKCDSRVRRLAQWHTYDYTDSTCKNPAFCTDSCNGHGWHSEKWSLGCTSICNCDNWIFDRYNSNHGLFINAEISAQNPNSNAVEGSAVGQWKNSPGHERLMVSRNSQVIGCSHFYQHATCFMAMNWG